MANPPRQKGTKWETGLLPTLRRLFGPRVERSSLSGINDYGDFINVPFLIEAKSTKKPLLQQWARICERKAGTAWAIIWHGDLRETSGTGPYVVMPLDLFELLVEYALDEAPMPLVSWKGPRRSKLDMLADDCRAELGGR